MSDDDISLSEKRVYAGSAGTIEVFVASEIGLVHVSVSDDVVGEFSIARRGPVTDVAGADGRLAIATPADVLVGTDSGFESTGFGPASAVGFADGLVAAGEGRLARYDGNWETTARIDNVRTIDGDLLAAADGIYDLEGRHLGLEGVQDVAAAGVPLAATNVGLYSLANGWTRVLEGQFCTVAIVDGDAYAAAGETLYRRTDTGWTGIELPVAGTIVDLAGDGGATHAVTASGVFLSNAGDGWRHRSVGVSGVESLAIQ